MPKFIRISVLLSLLFWMGLSLSAAEPILTGTALEDLKGTPPEAPSEYKTPQEVREALTSGKVKFINIFAPTPENVEILPGIEYGKGGEKSLQLDLYRPKNLTKAVPALMFIHGGAWSGGKREDYRFYAIDFAKRGYVVASVTYRLSGEAPFPAAVEDVKCAVRWLRTNAEQYNINPDQIAAIGGSAGGHLSMMVGYSSDVAELEGNGGNAGVSSRVQAVVNLYGPTDLTTDFARGKKPVLRFLSNKTLDEAAEQYKLASPITHVTKDDPPTLILHGTIDAVVPIRQGDMLAEKLKQTGIPYVYDRLPGWPHSMDLAQDVNDRCQWLIEHFLARYLPLPE